MFVEAGKSATDVSNKVTQMWNQFFVNGDAGTQKLFYPVGTDMAYILDTGNDDIRSEGMSYGMMICVQLDKKAEFDKLWKFAKTYSQHPAGASREGLFAWQLNKTNFSKKDDNSAPDGEEYYITALFFAHNRWGSGTGIFNYKAEADYILDNMLDKPAAGSGGCPTNLIDITKKQAVFGICGNSSTFTDPSYHLPAFYEIWARYAANNNQLWADMAVQSRTYLLPRASHPVTGLMPDYSTFDGVPVNDGDHGKFEYDAWRNIMNMGVDQAWFKQSSATVTPLINRQIDFFKNKPGYASLWTLDGTFSRTNDHSPGLVACNAVGSLALADAKVWPFIDEFFDMPIPSGQYRYYDGLLYMMSYMHLSGNFKVYKPGGVTNTLTVSPTTLSIGAAAAGSTITVTSNTSWTITDDQTWITTSAASGASNGSFTVNVTANAGSAGRNGVVTITGGGLTRTVSIAQSSGTSTIPIGKAITLAGNNARYVSTENGAQSGITCNRTAVGSWERFTVVSAGNGKIALKGTNGRYLSSENGAQAMRCDRTAIGATEAFDWVAVNSTTVQLRGNNARFVSSENGVGSMTCNRTAAGAWENFNWAENGTPFANISAATEEVLITNDADARFTVVAISGTAKMFRVTLPADINTLSVMDISGRQVNKIQVKGKRIVDVNLNNASGIYIIQAVSATKSMSKKIVVE
jgi:endo-1,4-beta-D-glucanase Y